MYQTVCINLSNNAATQFINHGFESCAFFDGKLFFCGQDGIFQSKGNLDNTNFINSEVKLPINDLGYHGRKRPRSLYIEGKFSGQMLFEITDEYGVTQEYYSNEMDEYTGCKIPLRHDQKSRYFIITIKNVDGADFVIDKIDIVYTKTSERSV